MHLVCKRQHAHSSCPLDHLPNLLLMGGTQPRVSLRQNTPHSIYKVRKHECILVVLDWIHVEFRKDVAGRGCFDERNCWVQVAWLVRLVRLERREHQPLVVGVMRCFGRLALEYSEHLDGRILSLPEDCKMATAQL